MLMRNAVVLNIFEREEGFLYGDVFVGMTNSVIKTVLKKEGTSDKEVQKALYLIEKEYNLMGLNLIENKLSEEIVSEKVIEIYDPLVEETDFEILSEGVSVEVENTSIPEKEISDVAPEQETISAQENVEEEVQVNIEQKDQTTQISLGDLFDSIVNKNNNVESKDAPNDKPEYISAVNNTEGHKLSREEKRNLTMNGIMEAFKVSNVMKLSDISEVVKGFVDVSDTTVRNVLLELSEEGTVIQERRGVYQIAKSLVSEQENVQEEQVQPVVQQPVIQVQQPNFSQAVSQETTSQQPVYQQPVTQQPAMQQPVVQEPIVQQVVAQHPVMQPVVQYASKEEVATVFPPLYKNNDPIVEYLEERGVRKTIINYVINQRSKNATRFASAPQEIVDRIETEPVYIGKVSVLEKAIAAMMRDQPLSLKGEAGTGKTTLVQTLSALLNLPLFSINGSLESNKATLVGEKDIDENRRLITKDGQMTKAMRWGAILYVDEINMMRPDVLSIVNAATDHRKTFYNDVSKETIVGHTDFRFISAMNVGYAGVKKMNEATMDRTASIVLTYLGKVEMKTLLKGIAEKENEKAAKVGAPELEVTDIVNLTSIYLTLTSEAKRGNVPMLAASTRNIILLAKLVPVLGYQLALEMMLDKFEDEAAAILGVLGKDELLEKLGVNVEDLMISMNE